MKKKELKKVIKKFTYKNKKSLCIFMVLAVLAGGVVIVKIRADKSKEIISTANYDRTVLIEKGEISNSINVNGKIESAEVSMVSTSLTEKVKSVNVKVGDYVKAGDVICTLDDGDITKEIEKKKAEIAENKKELEANYNKLSNQLTEARNVKIASVSAQDSIVSTLKSNYENIENVSFINLQVFVIYGNISLKLGLKFMKSLIVFLISVLLFLSIPYIIYKTFFDKPYDPFPDQPDIHNPNDFNL